MVCKGALPSMRGRCRQQARTGTNDEDGSEEGNASPQPLPLPRPHHLLLLLKAAAPVEDLKELPIAGPLRNLRHWHIHELLRRHLLSAQRGWIKVGTQFRP